MLKYRDYYIYEQNGEFTVGDSDGAKFDDLTLENFYCGVDETVMVAWNMQHENRLEFYELRNDCDEVSFEDYIRHFVDYNSDVSFVVPAVYFTTLDKAKEFIDWIMEGNDEGYSLNEEIQNEKDKAKVKNNIKTIDEQYDATLRMVENLIDNLQALHTDIVNASETDGLTIEDSEELDWMCLTINSAMQSVEEVAQAMAR